MSGTQKVCVPKMAPPDFPNRKFRFFPRWSLWSEGGGVQGAGGGAFLLRTAIQIPRPLLSKLRKSTELIRPLRLL